MSDNVVTLPPTNAPPAAPVAVEWLEVIEVTKGIQLGIEKMANGVFRVLRRFGHREDALIAPSAETAAALLLHVYFDLRTSSVGENIVGEELDAALFEIEELLQWMQAFKAILKEANFPPADEIAGLKRKQ